jgi:hypothetical protein
MAVVEAANVKALIGLSNLPFDAGPVNLLDLRFWSTQIALLSVPQRTVLEEKPCSGNFCLSPVAI